mgnify:FL=1
MPQFPTSSLRQSDQVSACQEVRGLALIVDDDASSRLWLAHLLAVEGFQTRQSANGLEALESFAEVRPDIVFMDVVMPEMDGFEAAHRIKVMAGTDFVPIIFLTGLQDEASLINCITAGGDDFLVKPFRPNLLKTRILAMERVRDLHRRVVADSQSLATMLERGHLEQGLAERVFARAIKSRNVLTDRLGLIQLPAAMFSGDLVLTQRLPDGGLRLLIGDFTGHGLAATIGALPIADAFHAMTRKGVGDEEVLLEINRKLHQILPADRFMATFLASVSADERMVSWWNGGMPSAWLRTSQGLSELPSHALPLGILPELTGAVTPRRIRMEMGDGLLLFTDGLLSARNSQGATFGEHGFQRVLHAWRHGERILPALLGAMDEHCGEATQADDIAVLELPLLPELFAEPEPIPERVSAGGWNWSIELRDEHLGNFHTVESVLRPLGLLDGLESHLPVLETIVAELYTNALEHGILRLNSLIKATEEGFETYYRQRTERLASCSRGWIRLQIGYQPRSDGGSFRVGILDSGPGFPGWELESEEGDDLPRPWGGGITLLRGLCESFCYRLGGREAEAVYRW